MQGECVPIQDIGEWLISSYVTTIKHKEYHDGNCIFSLILTFDRAHNTNFKDEALKRVGIKDVKLDKTFTSAIGEQVKEVFESIDKLRGYRPPKRNAEAASIQRMIKHGFAPKQIIECWRTLKQDKFWQGKELFLMTVESQIAAMTKKIDPSNKYQSQKYGHMVKGINNDPDKYIKGKYGHLVRR